MMHCMLAEEGSSKNIEEQWLSGLLKLFVCVGPFVRPLRLCLAGASWLKLHAHDIESGDIDTTAPSWPLYSMPLWGQPFECDCSLRIAHILTFSRLVYHNIKGRRCRCISDKCCLSHLDSVRSRLAIRREVGSPDTVRYGVTPIHALFAQLIRYQQCASFTPPFNSIARPGPREALRGTNGNDE